MTSLTLAMSNLRKTKMRSFLLMLSIFLGICTFGVLAAFERAFNADATSDVGRMITVNKISFTQPLPFAHFGRLRSVPGVGEATFASWFGGYYREPSNSLHAFAIDSETYLGVYRGDILLTEAEKAAFLRERTALLVGEAMARKWGWKVGDQVPVFSRSIAQRSGSQSWTFVIAGVFKAGSAQVDSNFMFLRHDYLNEARANGRDTIGWMVFRPSAASDGETVGTAVDRAFEAESDQTTTDTERNFNRAFAAQFGNVALAIVLVVGAALLSVLMIVGNTMMLSVRERTTDIGILKALGFPPERIARLLFVEALIISSAGGFLGLAAAHAAIRAVGPSLTQIAPGMTLSFGLIALGLALIVAVAGIATAGPAFFLSRLHAADALRRR
jgi:putative ABC transport system permease protein